MLSARQVELARDCYTSAVEGDPYSYVALQAWGVLEVCACVCMRGCMGVCVWLCVKGCVSECVRVHASVGVCVCMCVHLCADSFTMSCLDAQSTITYHILAYPTLS